MYTTYIKIQKQAYSHLDTINVILFPIRDKIYSFILENESYITL